MVQIKIKDTGEIQNVTRNMAHSLIDSGVAELVQQSKVMTANKNVRKQQNLSQNTGEYKTK